MSQNIKRHGELEKHMLLPRRERRKHRKSTEDIEKPLEVGSLWRPVMTPKPISYSRSAVEIFSITVTHVYIRNVILGFFRNVLIEEFLRDYQWVKRRRSPK